MTDYGVEKFAKSLMGAKVVEDALERLDMLTKEENLMTAARNLEVSHHVDVNVKATKELTHQVDDNVKAIQEVTYRVDDKVTRIEQVVHDVDGNVKAAKEFTHHVHENVVSIKEDSRNVNDNVKRGARHSLRAFIHVTDLYLSYIKTAMDDQQRPLLPHVPFTDCRG